MTEEEKSELRALKQETSERLAGVDFNAYRLREVDPRLDVYVREVAAAPERHNLWEQLAVVRFLGMCRRYGIDVAEVQRFYCFYENLYFPGNSGMTRYQLTPVQCFQFASVYGFKKPDGTRVVREAVLFVPRKFSKTTSSAAFAVYDLLYGDANAESYTGANSAQQAYKCFDVIRKIVQRLDPKGRRYTVNEGIIKSLRADRTAIAQCLTSNSRTKDGLNASTVIMDEFSQARDMGLLTVLTTSTGVRAEPLTVIITTASDVFDGPFYMMLAGYKALLRGEYDDDTTFAHLFEPDVDDPEDSETTWRKVQPHYGITVRPESYREQYQAAQRNGAEAMLAFRTKLLNIYAENERRSWISSTLARSLARDITLESLRGRPAMIAVDLSESDDFSAITVGTCKTGSDSSLSYHFHTDYFFPEGALPGHPNEKLYRAWAEKGFLHLLPGDVIDYRAIVGHILELKKIFNILGIGYDPYKSRQVINMLESAGAYGITRPIGQTLGNFTSPVENFEHGAKTGSITINGNPINFYCFGNAVLEYDSLENCKPGKRSHYQKIDGVITMLMTLRMFLDWEP